MKLIPAESIQALVQQHPEWSFFGGKLIRNWDFPDFMAAIAFVNRVATVAEEANHHPDIDIRYSKVCLALISHDAGGITNRDVAMVRRLDEWFKK